MLETVIIGAGPAGLVAAKECLEAGLNPVLFEKNAHPGGTWNQVSGKVWQSIRSNLSCFHLGFSDHIWPPHQEDYPSNHDIYNYLRSYTEKYALADRIHYHSEITGIRPGKQGINWLLELNGHREIACRNLIIANGFNGKGYVPALYQDPVFKGCILHSEHYKTAAGIRGRKVLVIGSGASGYEIASDLAHNGYEVTHLLMTTAWVGKRYVHTKGNSFPADLHHYCYPVSGIQQTATGRNREQIGWYKATYGNPGLVHPNLSVDEDPQNPVRSVICDDYPELVEKGFIHPCKGAVAALTEEGALLTAGGRIKADTIILCTGYTYALPFKDHSTRTMICREHNTAPALYHHTFHPDLQHICFIGTFPGAFWGIMELQARWAANLLAGNLFYPPASPEACKHNNKYSTADYVDTMCMLAHQLGAFPADLAAAAKMQRIPMIPADFRMTGIGAKPQLAALQRARLEQRINSPTILHDHPDIPNPAVYNPF